MKIIDNLARKLYLGVSKIPGAGVGLFAGTEIMGGTPVCEYKGEIFDIEEEKREDGLSPKLESEKKLGEKYGYTLQLGFDKPAALYSIGWASPDGKQKKLIDAQPSLTAEAIGLGGFVNDVLGWQERMKPEYAEERKQREENVKSIEGLKANKELDVKAGFNLEYWSHPTEVLIYLNALKDIKPGEELFVNYGDAYWNPFIKFLQKQAEAESKKEK